MRVRVVPGTGCGFLRREQCLGAWHTQAQLNSALNQLVAEQDAERVAQSKAQAAAELAEQVGPLLGCDNGFVWVKKDHQI